jgi:predicted HTH transcriptional regulator
LFVFDNRVEIHSPGALPGGLQVEDVLTGTSLPRNKTLFTHGAYLLPYSGVGSGFLRVRELDDKVEVVNDTKKKEVIVTFWRESNQESNQESVRPGVRVTEKSDRDNEKSVRPGDRPGDRAKAVLTGKELDIVNYCTVPRTSKEILARVGVSYHSKNLAKYVKSLVSKGFLKMTIPNKPNDPNQKYVKV